MRHIGLDAGSVSVKLVILDETGQAVHKDHRPHRGHPLSTAIEMLSSLPEEHDYSIAFTGTSGKLMASVLGVEPINEIVSQSYSVSRLHPHINTIIEMGGEDSKLIIMEDGGVKDFSMNSVCAAGTGSFLDQQAERLRLGIEEFSKLALKSKKPPRIAGRCSVFAKSDMIHLQQIATPMEDIVAGLCFAVARNFKGTIARGRNIVEPVAFQGGVAANDGMVRAFTEVFGLDELFIPPDFVLMGALGAAMKSQEDGIVNRFDKATVSKLEDFLKTVRAASESHEPLFEEKDDFFVRHKEFENETPAATGRVRAYMGIDIGSISTNLAVIDEQGRLLAKRYLMTAGRPIEAVRQGLDEISRELSEKFDSTGGVEIAGVATTGSGRYMIADYVGADLVKNEITAQATAASYINPEVDTIFEIGGQDSKFISLRDGVIVDFEMNKACAAGTGSFLEEQAEKLDVTVKGEFAELAFSAGTPSRLGERCTVFMENSLMANLQRGAEKEDLLAGLAYSIVQNYINRVVAGKSIGKNIFFQGGVAFNKSVVAAFEKYLNAKVTVPPNHDVTGAIGMALIAQRHMNESGNPASTFKGFGLLDSSYELSSFECGACSNMCEINRVKIEGDKGYLFYGGRCEKYDINKKKLQEAKSVPDLFGYREKALLACTEQEPKNPKGKRIGIPYIFHMHDQMPYWWTLLNELGFNVVVSPGTNRQIVELGHDTVLAEACFPVKVALGHIKYLVDQDVDAVFLPSFKNLNPKNEEYDLGQTCPHTQTIPYVAKVAMEGLKYIAPVINKSLGEQQTLKELRKVLKTYGARTGAIQRAMLAAQKEQAAFEAAVKAKGREALASLDEKALVVVGRGYNAFEKGMNLRIPEKLATLGVTAIPMDMLPLDEPLSDDWPNMYWRSGQKILRAARYIDRNPLLYPIYIGNFSCGPDSFILKFFKRELRGKPFLHIEIDEHSADAGAITRCEAFLDSIENRNDQPSGQPAKRRGHAPQKRTVLIPRMSDHSWALAAAFERGNVPAEVMPESDGATVDYGMRYASGKECYPCIVTTGDMVKIALSADFKPDESAFFMPSGTGPCRFGQYNVFHRQVLDDLGFEQVPVIAPNQDVGFYNNLGELCKDFARDAWHGVVAIELLGKSLRQVRPYEKNRGETDELYQDYLRKAYLSLKGSDGSIETLLQNARRDFEAVKVNDEPRPLIGVMGEIFVRSNDFSNEDLVRKIENLGGEAWLAPVEEWLYYISLMALRRSLINRDFSTIITVLLKEFVQRRVERRFGAHFEGFLKNLHEPSTREILKKASPYVPDSFEGETVLSIGKSVDFAARGCSGVVNAMPFGCMPGTIVTALMRAVSRDLDLPSISLPYDGTESSTIEMQLEAFMDQAKNRAAKVNIKARR